MSYCKECKINLCTLCQEHKGHKRIIYVDELPNKKKLIKKKNELKDKIYLINKDIKF